VTDDVEQEVVQTENTDEQSTDTPVEIEHNRQQEYQDSEQTEMVEVPDRFLSKPFDEYTTVEGFLLMFLILAICVICVKILKGAFQWLM